MEIDRGGENRWSTRRGQGGGGWGDSERKWPRWFFSSVMMKLFQKSPCLMQRWRWCVRDRRKGEEKETGDGKEKSGRIDREQGCIYKYMKKMKNKKRTDEGNKIKSRRDTLKKLSMTFIWRVLLTTLKKDSTKCWDKDSDDSTSTTLLCWWKAPSCVWWLDEV